MNCPVNYGSIPDDSALQGLIGEGWNLTEEGTESVNVIFENVGLKTIHKSENKGS